MRRLFRSKVAWGIAIAAAAAIGVFGFSQVKADVIQDCSNNSIIKCGKHTPTDFISATKANNPRDLQAIYQEFGLAPSDYDKFVTQAKEGMAYRDGTIKVDGQTVATDAWSIGRYSKSYSSPMTIGSNTYHRSPATSVLRQDLPVMVLFDDKGAMQFAVMKACGNPTTGKKVTPSYSCDLLQKTSVEGQKNTYSFTTQASATNGATLAKVVYDFGDGSEPVTKTSLSEPVSHTYAKEGSYTAKVTVYVTLPGGGQIPVTSATCATPITVEAPPVVAYTCDSLQALPSKENDLEYTIQVNTSSTNASLIGADFDFGDGLSAPNVAPGNDVDAVSVNHTFAKPGNYTVRATVNFEVTDENDTKTVKSVNCQTEVNTEVCKYNPNLPPDSAKCAKPVATVLPNTGTGDVLGIFAGASLLGFAAYRFYLSRKFLRN